MLTELRIRDLAIIKDVKLTLAPGFNVLTGETGAGKSIIVGALGLLLGERASADLVRGGAPRARVEAVFDALDRPALLADLDMRGIDATDGTVILSREVMSGAGGRSRAWINGSPVTTGVLGDVARALVNLHGQHESQSLLVAGVQRDLLDAFGEALADAERVRSAYEAQEAIRQQVSGLESRRRVARRERDRSSQTRSRGRSGVGRRGTAPDECRGVAAPCCRRRGCARRPRRSTGETRPGAA